MSPTVYNIQRHRDQQRTEASVLHVNYHRGRLNYSITEQEHMHL